MNLLESIHLVRLTIKWKKCVLEIENSINLLKKKKKEEKTLTGDDSLNRLNNGIGMDKTDK